MPLTTRHRDGRRLDSTDDAVWAEVHKPGHPGLFCPECDYAMHAVAGGHRRIRHFAHNPGRSGACTFVTGESPEHLRTKALIADAVRLLDGWSAEIEAPGDGWRADVLAIGPHQDELGDRRIAFEPQFSYIHPDTARERTERHRSAGVETVWLPTTPRVEHVSMFTWARLHYEGPDAVEASAHQLNREPEDGDPKPPWWPARRLNVKDFVQAVCLGEITFDGTAWASDAQRAEFARREQAFVLRCRQRGVATPKERAEIARRRVRWAAEDAAAAAERDAKAREAQRLRAAEWPVERIRALMAERPLNMPRLLRARKPTSRLGASSRRR